MAANIAFERVNELNGLRGFANLLHKEQRAWWGTRRWWINALLWTGMLGGLTGIMVFVMPSLAEASGDPEVAAMGGVVAFGMELGRTVFFQMSCLALAIGMVVSSQDAILSEKHAGVTEWILSKPVQRRSYVLAKLAAALLDLPLLLIILPSAIAYLMLSLRGGTPYPLLPFLGGVGIVSVHTLFYLTLTLLLGTIFNSRGPILGITLGFLLGGSVLGGLVKPLLYITPWMLSKIVPMVVGSQPYPVEMLWAPLVTSLVWSVIFVIVTLAKFEKIEF
jgi:ABC-2 type transport system permease protein